MKIHRSPLRYTAPLVVLGLVALSACGDDPDASGPPVLIVTQSADASRSAAPMASEAAGMAADGKLMPYFQTRLVATVDLPALDSDAPAYEIRSGEPDFEVLKSAFGLDADFEAVDPANGGGWTAGPNDGSAPSMSVYTWSGMSNWSYSPAWAKDASVMVDCGVAVSSSGDTVAPAPECATPEPPTGVPTAAEAETAFGEIMGKLGVDTSNLKVETYADQWSASVTGYLLVDGVRSPLTYSVGFGAEGAVQWASGFLGDVVKIADYPRIGTAAAIERLNEQMTGYGPRVMVDDMMASDTVSGDGATEPAAAGDTLPPDPASTDVATTEPELTAPEVQDVNVVGVEEELQILYGDGVTYLVPGYAFLGEAQDQYTPRYSVIAIPDEYIQESVPTVDAAVVPVPADASVAGSSSGGSSDASEPSVVDAEALFVGQSEDDAAVIAKKNGLEVRVVERDGQQFPGTMDYRTDRVNIVVTDGKVTSATIG